MMRVLRDAGARRMHHVNEVLDLQGVERLHYVALGKAHHRIAIALLVARVHERVDRDRIILRRRPLLLDQAAEDPRFNRVEYKVHERSITQSFIE